MTIRRYASSGGIVWHDGRVLLVRKKCPPEVRLPKGHIEPGETRVAAAVREVGEETGYVDLRVVRDLGSLEVEFDLGHERVQRHESFFLMDLASLQVRPRPEKEREKFEVIWVSPAEALAELTFESEREFLRRAWAGRQD